MHYTDEGLPLPFMKAGQVSGSSSSYDPHFTNRVIAATGRNAHARLGQIMPALIRHLHDFAREVDLTFAEWMAGVDMINEAGRMSTNKRNETQLICDILGLESLVEEITAKLFARETTRSNGCGGSKNNNNKDPTPTPTPTPSAVLGPFYRADAPVLANGSSIVLTSTSTSAAALQARISGRVLSAATRKPIPGAVVDIWLAAPNGLYEQQDPDQPDMNLRGRFRTDGEGRYEIYALRPTAYPIPQDGPAGRLLRLLDRGAYRPAHIHFMVAAAGHRALITQLFDHDRDHDENDDDAVFAAKDDLRVVFRERRGDDRAKWELEYDFVLLGET
ncbi:Intradiol ring-cleavage dioxygenase [Nemania sp. FL0916]|nr:Intradiol ring-cleavage dioxygenase [Nemania sp. FL0916]